MLNRVNCRSGSVSKRVTPRKRKKPLFIHILIQSFKRSWLGLGHLSQKASWGIKIPDKSNAQDSHFHPNSSSPVTGKEAGMETPGLLGLVVPGKKGRTAGAKHPRLVENNDVDVNRFRLVPWPVQHYPTFCSQGNYRRGAM